MVLLEVGPGRTLGTMARGQVEPGRLVVSSLRHPRESRSDVATMLSALGRLWVEGIEPDWAGFHRGARRLRVRLPLTPFERRRYFLDAPGAFRFGAAAAPAGPEETVAVPLPAADGTGNGAPTDEVDEVEAKLLEIWRQLLGLPEIRPDQDFFELGGHSLLATRVVSRVRDVFRAELPLEAFFAAPTIAGLAAHLRGAAPAAQVPPPIEPAPRAEDLPLSFAQRRLWFLDRLHPGTPAYNVHDTVRLRGPLDVPAAAAALREIAARHEVLRTTYELRGEEPVQVVHPTVATELPLADLSALPEPAREAEARRLAARHARRLFDLAAGPVLRTALLRLGEREHALLLTLHHIAFDGWSWGVLYGELGALYEAFRAGRPPLPPALPPLPVQYADYAVWQRQWIAGRIEEEQLAYWRRRLAGLQPLALPTDRPQPKEPDFRSAAHPVSLPGELVDGMAELARRNGCTLFMGLLAVFQVLLHAWTGEEDVAVGSPVAGRTRPEVELLIGFFINTLVLRGDLSGDPEVGELLARVREGTIGAHSHQDVPFDRVVSALRADGGGEPLYRVWFVLQNTPMPSLELPGLAAVPRWGDSGAARHDLNLTLWPGDGGLVGYVEYRTELFDAPTVTRLADRFTLLLRAVLAQPDQRLSVLTGSVERAEDERRTAKKAELKAAGLDRLQGLRRKSGAPAPEGGPR
jgi:acyl carrier protein